MYRNYVFVVSKTVNYNWTVNFLPFLFKCFKMNHSHVKNVVFPLTFPGPVQILFSFLDFD